MELTQTEKMMLAAKQQIILRKAIHNEGDKSMFKLWIDDLRPAPPGYVWLKSTNEALRFIRTNYAAITHIDLDHDAGEYTAVGGDYIGVLKELERLSRNSRWAPVYKDIIAEYTFRLHSANPVGVANMRAILEKNNWREIR